MTQKLQRAIAEYRGVPLERIIPSLPQESSVDEEKPTGSSQPISGPSPSTASSETKRKYRRHPKPDENAPERPPSAYVIFSNKVREDVKEQNLSFTQIAKLVGDRWQKLDPAGKEPFEAQANAAKEKYNIQLSTYKKTEAYRDYQQYLADFKTKHGGNVEQKRPRLDPQSSGGSISGKSLELDVDLLAPTQGHVRGTSTGSMSSTVMPSPSSNQGLFSIQTHVPGKFPPTRVAEGSSRSNSPPHPLNSRDILRRGQLSTQSSTSDESSARRSDSDPLVRTASLSLSTPPSGATPPLPPPQTSLTVSEFGVQEVSRLRYSGSNQPTILGPPGATSGSAAHPFQQTLPAPAMSEASWRSRGPDLRSYLEPGRAIATPTYLTSGAPNLPISLPPLTGQDRIGDISAQRVLPLPRTSPTAYQSVGQPGLPRTGESPNPYFQGQGRGQGSATQSPFDRSESDAADALAGLAGFSSSGSRPETAKPWDAQQRWPRR